jgi:hypothetical protein
VATNPKEFRVKNGLEITAGPIKINGSTGTSGQVISSTGTGVEWTAATAGSGSVTSITAGTGLSVSGGANPITTSGTITIDSTVATLTGTQTLTNKTLTSPTLTTPALGTPASGTLTNCTFPTLNQNTTGSAGSVANTLTITSPLSGTSYNGSAAVSIGIPVATASANGYLSSTDWTTFNNKGSGTVTSVTGTSPVVSSGGATPAISMPAASSGVNGYMTGTYATKLDGITAGATANSGTVTSVAGTGNVSGITLTGTVTGSGSLTLGGSIGTLNQNTTGSAGSVPASGITGSTLASNVTASSLTSVGTLTGLSVSGTINSTGAITQAGNQVLHAGNYSSYAVVANPTTSSNIDSDWGQSFKTFDPVPTGTPPISSPNIRTINIGDNYGRRTQLAFPYESDRAFLRRRNDSTWQSWVEFLTTSNYSSYALPITGGTLTGQLRLFYGGSPEILFRHGGYPSIWGGRLQMLDYGDGMGINFDTSNSVDTFGTRMVIRHNGRVGIANTNPQYTLDVTGTVRATDRIHSNEWIQFSNFTGLYSPNNGAHFLPNSSSYGSWKVLGSRNGWCGLEFETSANGNVSLMIAQNGGTSGFHNNSHGWQMRWNAGTIYCNKGANGAGTEATVLDSSNYTSYAIARNGDTVDGIMYFRSNKGNNVYLANTNNMQLQVYSSDGGTAAMSFHRSAQYAVNFGLDPDNVLRLGGWSAPANVLQVNMSGDLTMLRHINATTDLTHYGGHRVPKTFVQSGEPGGTINNGDVWLQY